MARLRTLVAHLAVVGRCVLMGMLVGMLATQSVAEGATVASQQAPAKPDATSVSIGSQIEQIKLSTVANLPLAARESADADLNAMPDAPTVSTGRSDAASVTMPPELKAMMDDAAQNSQGVQPAPAKKSHGIQRPGMLIMGIVGIPLAFIGVGIYSIDTNETGKKIGVGTAFFAPGAAMSVFGFYLAFKPRH